MYTRLNPFLAQVTERYCLNKQGSTRETWHVALDLTGSDIAFRPGDSIGIVPDNDIETAKSILRHLNATGKEIIEEPKWGGVTAYDLFLRKVNIAAPSKRLLEALQSPLIQSHTEEKLDEYLQTHDVEEVLAMHPGGNLQKIAAVLPPLLPRLYSVASSPLATNTIVHLTVARVIYNVDSHKRRGVCSHYLVDQVPLHKKIIPVYLQPTKEFLLPEDVSKKIIMIGPGTGVAPFRAFMQERLSRGSPQGVSWLFFGERNRNSDFFYEDFWRSLENEGLLQLDAAFSRDTTEKVYVQHKMWEKRELFWRWLQDGAIVYVCGDASRMAKDVDSMLQQIVVDQGKLSVDAAKAFVKEMRMQKRYLRDVY